MTQIYFLRHEQAVYQWKEDRTILHSYDPSFCCQDFLRIIDFMP